MMLFGRARVLFNWMGVLYGVGRKLDEIGLSRERVCFGI
jgi:hypothetical protein